MLNTYFIPFVLLIALMDWKITWRRGGEENGDKRGKTPMEWKVWRKIRAVAACSYFKWGNNCDMSQLDGGYCNCSIWQLLALDQKRKKRN